jgi:DNA-binding SARP family transcriptional activator
VADTGRALASVAALAVFVVGVPAGNLATGGGPDQLLPVELPDLHDPDAVWQAVRWSYLDGHLVPWLAHVAAWLGWALGVVLVLLDLARLLRAGSAAVHRHLATRSPRAWITSTVAAALILFSASNAVASPASGSPVVATADQHPQPATAPPDPFHVPDDVRPDCPRHQVVRGDTYWSLAEHHLGDGRRYVEIDALNRDRIPDFHVLEPGMMLLLPPDADNLLQPVPVGAHEVIVRAGESASSIAEREYGDATAWIKLWDLNRDRPQPDGRAWRNPDLVLPGWHLVITGPSTTAAAPGPTRPAPSPSAPPPTAPPAAPTAVPSPATSTPASTATTVPSLSHSSAPTPTAAVTLPTGAFVGIGLAAFVTAAVFTVRLRQRRYRSRRPDPTLRPAVRALRIEYDRATLPRDADGGLRYPDPVPSDASRRNEAAATAELLLPAGQTPLGLREGQLAALDIAGTNGLGLAGPGAVPAARALLVSHYAPDQPEILIPQSDLPLLFDTADLDNTPALTITADANSALDQLAIAAELGQDGPRFVLVMTALDPSVQARLENLIEDYPGRVLAIVLGRWPSGTTITVSADGLASSSRWAGTRLFSLPSADAADLLTLLPQANADEVPAAEDSAFESPGPARPPVHFEQVQERRELQLHVLGRLHLRRLGDGTEDLIGVLAPRQREILVYLSLHQSGCRRETLTADLWPDAPIDRPYNAFHATLSQMRTALRKATDGAVDEIVTNIDGHFALDPERVTVDLWQLQAALSDTRHTLVADERLAALHQVANLYTGRLADGFAAAWVEAPRQAIHRSAIGALSQLIRQVGQHEPSKVIPLLEHARELEPYNEAVYRALMRAHARLGQHGSIQRTLTLLATALAEIDAQPTADTVQLARTLSAQRGA